MFAKKSALFNVISSHLLLLSRTKGAKKLTFSIDFNLKNDDFIYENQMKFAK